MIMYGELKVCDTVDKRIRYRAANWTELGLTQGYRRTRAGYSAPHTMHPSDSSFTPYVATPKRC